MRLSRPVPLVLVVDDQPIVCSMVRRELRSRCQCEVDIALSGEEALSYLRRGIDYAYILCDLLMPHVSGWDVLETARHERPELVARFVLMTAKSSTHDEERRLAEEGVRILSKPFGLDELLKVVQDLPRTERRGRW